MMPENVLMHDKIRKKLIELMVLLLSEAVEEGVNKGIFACDKLSRMLSLSRPYLT